VQSGGTSPKRTKGAARASGTRLLVLVLLLAAPSSSRADGPMVRYRGMHPLSPHQGAYCYVDALHLHRVTPPDMRVYVVLKDGENVFVGDPVALGYDGPKFGYFGPHPLAVATAGATAGATEAPPIFCYIAGPHFHATPPPPSPAMVQKDGVYWYVGPPPPSDPARLWVNEVHGIANYSPPKVSVSAAPPGYHPFDTGQRTPAPVPLTAPAPARPRRAKPPQPAVGQP
jgi:hypothetical protein